MLTAITAHTWGRVPRPLLPPSRFCGRSSRPPPSSSSSAGYPRPPTPAPSGSVQPAQSNIILLRSDSFRGVGCDYPRVSRLAFFNCVQNILDTRVFFPVTIHHTSFVRYLRVEWNWMELDTVFLCSRQDILSSSLPKACSISLSPQLYRSNDSIH